MVIASFAVLIMFAGLGVVGFTYFSTNVVLPDEIPLPQSTTVYTSDGKGLVAKLGNENRTLVTISQMPQHVRDAVAAAEDRNFYRHSGVDYKGIARAAWNNFTGGDRQGASTITQQYARNAYESLEDDTYARKVREAIFASKLNDKFSKDEIMENYLNVIYFGRGAYGVEAAAQTFFGKPASKLTVGEGAVLAGLIKQPEKTATHNGYDPATSPDDAKSRWDYVLDGMVAEGWLDAAERPTEYPEVKPPAEGGNGFGVATPRGNVINYVRAEMEQWGLCTNTGAEGRPSCFDELRMGGYRITTTIDDKMQTAMENAARAEAKGSPLNGEPDNLQAAGVAVDPKTGRVLAYYGGESGANTDYAGMNTDENGTLYGGHPPASSFKVYTLAAAIEAGISVNSRWDATPFTPEGYDNRIYNAGRNATCRNSCTLDESTVESYNVPFFHVAEQIGPDKVVGMARQAGITTMWNESKETVHNLLAEKPEDLAPEHFDRVVGYGQYPITVLDHANGLATLANDGVFHQAHFVLKVEQKDEDTGEWKVVRGTGEKLDGQQRIRKQVTDEVTGVLKQIPNKGALSGGREAAGKTGTWELDGTAYNSNAWMVGYDDNLATAIWIGSRYRDESPAIKYESGKDIGGSSMPADVWKKFMNEALKDAPKSDLPSITGVGDDTVGNGEPPEPEEPDCGALGLFCDDNDDNDGNNNGGNNGGNNGNDGNNNGGNNGNDGNNNGGGNGNDGNDNGGGNDGDIGFPPPQNGGPERPGRD
ncbi:transglycosylase domain-containing protein [Salinispora mooreana]|uniref:transglycosylase domain-containing protein n=1 Tax=Salinispora mooreana TaxID=999545 RepID=UPI00039D27F2|nr:transglycosylase domain-containing protein [Salinispora mooreana]